MLFLQILLNSAVISVQTLLIGAGLYLIYNVAGMYAVHLGAAMMFGAYTYYGVVFDLGLHSFWGFLLAILVAMLLMFISYFILRPTIQTEERSLSLLISIALLTGGEAAIGLIFGSAPKFLFEGVIPVYEFWGLQINLTGLALLGFGLMSILVAFFFLFATPAGRKMRAVKQHRFSAQALGIGVQKIQIITFMLAGALVGVNGVLATMNDVATPTYATDIIFTAIIAYIVGGVNSFKGLVVCTFGIVLMVELMTSLSFMDFNISSTWRSAIIFAVALVVLLLRPYGFFHLKTRLN